MYGPFVADPSDPKDVHAADEPATLPAVKTWPSEPDPEVVSGFMEPTPPPEWGSADGWIEDNTSEEGDGPFPVDLDGSSSSKAAISEVAAPRSAFAAAPTLGTRPLGALPVVRRTDEVRVDRRRPREKTAAPTGAPHSAEKVPTRHYPKMRALLAQPERVPEGMDPLPEPRPPPVPGTFIPNPPPPPPRPEPGELDALLALMADGLFIGEGEGGSTEVRVTLRDEFFCGTELRIGLDDGQVSALLVPPTREIYWQLGGETHLLRDRLERRGLRVAELKVAEPEA